MYLHQFKKGMIKTPVWQYFDFALYIFRKLSIGCGERLFLDHEVAFTHAVICCAMVV